MILKQKEEWSNKAGSTYTVEDACEYALTPDLWGNEGVAERAQERAEKNSKMIARIVAHLHAAGTLSDEDTLELLGYGWEVMA